MPLCHFYPPGRWVHGLPCLGAADAGRTAWHNRLTELTFLTRRSANRLEKCRKRRFASTARHAGKKVRQQVFTACLGEMYTNRRLICGCRYEKSPLGGAFSLSYDKDTAKTGKKQMALTIGRDEGRIVKILPPAGVRQPAVATADDAAATLAAGRPSPRHRPRPHRRTLRSGGPI